MGQPKIWGVRMYPGGGVICHKVDAKEVMELGEALAALKAGGPVCVPVEHVFLMRYLKRMRNFTRRSLVAMEMARLMFELDERGTNGQ